MQEGIILIGSERSRFSIVPATTALLERMPRLSRVPSKINDDRREVGEHESSLE
jgi:hypothetical protein